MSLEVRRLARGDGPALADLFAAIVAAGADRHFHPHPLSAEQARRLADEYAGQDIYLVAVDDGRVVGYGMLRGWDEGYAVPSLGIVVRPEAHRKGIGRAMMNALHAAAATRGASAVRLRVYPDNAPALTLYRKMGYGFSGKDNGQLIGQIMLDGPRSEQENDQPG